ncbi:MAG: hypothetical protein GY832_09935 [Chloroflexi bacterium]|nr:hypothetical protein [Chloroflexota bacterium]
MSEGKVINRTVVTILMIPAVIFACILIFFGVLFIWGAFSPEGDSGWITIGVITVAVGIGIITLAVGFFIFMRIRRLRESQQPQEIVQKIDLSGDIELETLKCQKCGGELQKDSVSVREGAVFIDCPYCGSAYQMVEEPKW